MLKILMKNRLRKMGSASHQITREEIDRSSKILFVVFSRYGDAIAGFKVIKEFISLHPDKTFFILTSPQLSPYAREIIGGNADLSYVNRRRNPLKLFRIIQKLRREKIDLGLNPLSWGMDSDFFISFAKAFSPFKEYCRRPVHYNLYDSVREYLVMPEKEINPRPPAFDEIRNIIVAPSSTEIRKSLDRDDLAKLLRQLMDRFSNPDITVAVPARDWKNVHGVKKFKLGKAIKNSEEFLKLVKSADLFVGVDAGPLHLADALGIRAIGIFGPNAPETFMDRDSGILPIRYEGLGGIVCLLHGCKDPVCIHKLFGTSFLGGTATIKFGRHFEHERNVCRAA